MTVEFHVHRSRIFALLVCAAIGLLLASFPRSQTATEVTHLRPANEGAIAGVISYFGPPPRSKRIDTSADFVCSQKSPRVMTEDDVVRNGKLANVFVYLKDGTTADGTKLGDIDFPVSANDVVLDQDGCRFVPHVLGIQVNQKLRITNSDPTQHNIHPTPRSNAEWNYSQPAGAEPLFKTFNRAEVLIPVKCNQHPWMKAYVGVIKHPFFAVSKVDGTFEISGVPPGTYTLAAWHEGGMNGTEQITQVVVTPKGITSVDFSFGGATASTRRPSLQMMPALEMPMISQH